MATDLIAGMTASHTTRLPVRVTNLGDATGALVTTSASSASTTIAVGGGQMAVAAAATDVAAIYAESSVTAYLRRLVVSGIATAAGAYTVKLEAYGDMYAGGTSTTPDLLYVNTLASAPGPYRLDLFTANPTVGTSLGTLARQYLQVSSAAAAVVPVPMVFDFRERPIRIEPPQYVAINLNGATIAGLTLNVWAEMATEL